MVMEEKRKLFGIRLSAIVESIIALTILLVLDLAFGDGTRYFDWNPHPFWIVVILVAAHYGPNEGILAAILASVFLLLGNIPARADEIAEWDHFYAIWKNPIWWVFFGWLVGTVRARHMK